MTILKQEIYDLLIERLDANHNAHKHSSPFQHIKIAIQRDAQTLESGVSVNTVALSIAYSAIESNIALAGKKYQTGYDEILLFELDCAMGK